MDEPRWLTGEQQQAWRRFVEVLVKVPAALEAQLQRDAGLTTWVTWSCSTCPSATTADWR